MRKIMMLVATALGILFLTGCSGPKTYDEISYSDLTKMLDDKEDFVLFIGSETCSACSAYKITVNKIVEKYGVDIKYLDISKLSDEENSELSSNFAFSGTPTTIFVTDGKEKDTYNRIDGNAKYSKTVEKLKENAYIKE